MYRFVASKREEAVAGIRDLFEHGLAERGEFYIVRHDEQGNAPSVFDVHAEGRAAVRSGNSKQATFLRRHRSDALARAAAFVSQSPRVGRWLSCFVLGVRTSCPAASSQK